MTRREFAREIRAEAERCTTKGVSMCLKALADKLDGTDPNALRRFDTSNKSGSMFLVVGQGPIHKAHFVVGAKTAEAAILLAKEHCPGMEMEWSAEVLEMRNGVMGGMILA